MDLRFSICDLRLNNAEPLRASKQYMPFNRKSQIENRQFAILVSISLLSFLAGCQKYIRIAEDRQDTASMSEMAFLHHLATAPTVSVGEGRRAVSLLLPEADTSALIRDSWGLSDSDVLDKGTLAYMLRTACDLQRGVNEVVFSETVGLGDRRYALRTCTYEGIMLYGRADEPVTGGELLSALRAAESSVPCKASYTMTEP